MLIHWDTILTGLISAALLAGVKKLTAALRQYQSDSHKWREGLTSRMDTQDGKIEVIIGAQCSQLRSDIVHKCHRYADDLHAASIEEKQALYAEYEDYQRLCKENDIVNHFVDTLVEQAMNLPDRSI